MVGAVTTLIVIVAVFLAYNANNGLPFVPTYRVSVVVPNARAPDQEQRGADRRLPGGRRRVDRHHPRRPEGAGQAGHPGRHHRPTTHQPVDRQQHLLRRGEAQPEAGQVGVAAARGLDLQGPLPLLVRPQVPGDHPRHGPAAPEGYVFDGLDDSGKCQLPTTRRPSPSTIPASARNGCFQKQTEFDAINDTFDTQTRNNVRKNLVGYGDAFAGRGASLNEAIAKLRPLFTNLKPVSKVLASPTPSCAGSSRRSATPREIVAPVAVQQADFFGNAVDRLRRDLLRSRGAPGDDLRGRRRWSPRGRASCAASARS